MPPRSTTAVPEPELSANGGRTRPCSRNGDVRTVVYWMTTVTGRNCPASVVRAGEPSIHTSHRALFADQRNSYEAAAYPTEKDALACPPAGAGPNLKPMSCAVLALRALLARRASASS